MRQVATCSAFLSNCDSIEEYCGGLGANSEPRPRMVAKELPISRGRSAMTDGVTAASVHVRPGQHPCAHGGWKRFFGSSIVVRGCERRHRCPE
jgi:hypothetical protein